jgi:hypothetical protein
MSGLEEMGWMIGAMSGSRDFRFVTLARSTVTIAMVVESEQNGVMSE